jgi:GntR family transcriptional repressor for pyruvate dehydrogenase complex
VSRGTVREAVQFLQALGLLEVRHGSGTVVSHQPEDRQALRQVWQTWTARNVGRIRELLEVRRGLDLFAAELASRRRVPDALQTMADAIGQMRAGMRDDDVTAGVQADVLFHRAVGEATGNIALIELIESIGEQLMQERAALLSQPARPQLSLDEHTAIYDAIRAGDPELARAAALAHLESVEKGIDELAVKP